MNTDFDAIIVGSGPAGVSAAFPLLAAGWRVLMVDGGREPALAAPDGSYLTNRAGSLQQWEWLVGRDFRALAEADAGSPKLRMPTQAHVFDGFATANRIKAQDFVAVGSLAQGGLSNAWGCGVARLSAAELSAWPFAAAELDASYDAVARRMGISGPRGDDLSDYFGLDSCSQRAVDIDRLHTHLHARYTLQSSKLLKRGFRLGRSRVALLTESRGERQACNLSGNCLFGCSRKALYSAAWDLAQLKSQAGFSHLPAFIVDRIESAAGLCTVSGADTLGHRVIRAKRVILAAGTLATTRLALGALTQQINGFSGSVAMQACPTAAFLLWSPRLLGTPREASIGIGQLAFTQQVTPDLRGCGALFSTTGIPLAEFVRHLPFGKRQGIDVLGSLLSSCTVGNLFLPGHLTHTRLTLERDNTLRVEGGYAPALAQLLPVIEKQLRTAFLRLGALLLPGSFTVGRAGSDIHYAASLPMCAEPRPGETHANGELYGVPGMYIADGASLSALTEKPHTLTIMANADRIARQLTTEAPV